MRPIRFDVSMAEDKEVVGNGFKPFPTAVRLPAAGRPHATLTKVTYGKVALMKEYFDLFPYH